MAKSPEKGAGGVSTFEILMDGKPIKDSLAIIQIKTKAHINHIPEAKVQVLTGPISESSFDEADDKTFQPGAGMEIKLGYDGTNVSVFKGMVTRLNLKADASGSPMVEVYARDQAMALQGPRKSKLHAEKTDADVIKTIVDKAGLTAKVQATTGERSQIQNQCNDWDFIRLLSDRNGLVLHCEAGIVNAVPLEAEAAKLEVTLGADIIALDVRSDAQGHINAAPTATWSAIDVARSDAAGAKFAASGWGQSSTGQIKKALKGRTEALVTRHSAPLTPLNTMSKALLARANLAAMQGTCCFQGSAEAAPHTTLSLKGVGNRFAGDGYISGVDHTVAKGNWTTEVTLGLPATQAVDTPGFGGPAAAGLATPIHGVQVGQVKAIDQDPVGEQRIQVLLPMIGAEDAEIWARYAQPYASNGAGIQFMPEVDDEVVVAFFDGDPEGAVVLGALHNGKAKQAQNPDEKNSIKAIVSREKLKLTLDDKDRIMTFETPGGHKVVMDDKSKSIEMTCSNGNTLVLDKGGITLKSAKDIQLKASGAIDVKANKDLTLEGMNVNAKASMGLEASGGTTATLKGGAQTTVKGGVVMIN